VIVVAEHVTSPTSNRSEEPWTEISSWIDGISTIVSETDSYGQYSEPDQ